MQTDQCNPVLQKDQKLRLNIHLILLILPVINELNKMV